MRKSERKMFIYTCLQIKHQILLDKEKPNSPCRKQFVMTHNQPKHRVAYAGINLTGYHPPGLTPGPLPKPRTAFQCKTSAPWLKNETEIPTPRHNLPSSNANISMKKEHYSVKAVSFQIFHNCPFDNLLLL